MTTETIPQAPAADEPPVELHRLWMQISEMAITCCVLLAGASLLARDPAAFAPPSAPVMCEWDSGATRVLLARLHPHAEGFTAAFALAALVLWLLRVASVYRRDRRVPT